MNYRTKQALGVFVALAVAILVSALAARDAHADPLINSWRAAQSACQERPDGLACLQRDRLARALRSNGAVQLPNDEWTTKADVAYFDQVARKIAARAPDAIRLGVPQALAEQAVDALRISMTDAQIIGTWRLHRDALLKQSPAAYAVMTFLTIYLARLHPSTDPRYMVDN
jgi:hypothetical protein